MFGKHPKYLRVKDQATKHEYSIVASTFDEEAHELLDKPAAQSDGRPLPTKHYVALKSLSSSTESPAEAAAESPVESPVETPVESSTTERPKGRTIRQGE